MGNPSAAHPQAERLKGEEQDRYWTGSCWAMPGDQRETYIFLTATDLAHGIWNLWQRWPKQQDAKDMKVYEVEMLGPQPPKLRFRILGLA